jgi:hypothetical protein
MAETTVRAFIEKLTELAADLPNGLDSPVDLAICDGTDLVILEAVDMDVLSTIRTEEPVGEVTRQSVMVRGHNHAGDGPGEVYRGLVGHVDEELRKLTEDP